MCVRAAPSEPESRFFLSPPLWILFTKLWTSDECLHLFSLCKYDFSFDFFLFDSIFFFFFFGTQRSSDPETVFIFCLFLRFKTTGWRCNARWWQGVAFFSFLFHFIFIFFGIRSNTHTPQWWSAEVTDVIYAWQTENKRGRKKKHVNVSLFLRLLE